MKTTKQKNLQNNSKYFMMFNFSFQRRVTHQQFSLTDNFSPDFYVERAKQDVLPGFVQQELAEFGQ